MNKIDEKIEKLKTNAKKAVESVDKQASKIVQNENYEKVKKLFSEEKADTEKYEE